MFSYDCGHICCGGRDRRLGVHFHGWIRPEWFSGCTFTRCVFPAALDKAAFAAGHNTVASCLWSDETLP